MKHAQRIAAMVKMDIDPFMDEETFIQSLLTEIWVINGEECPVVKVNNSLIKPGVVEFYKKADGVDCTKCERLHG